MCMSAHYRGPERLIHPIQREAKLSKNYNSVAAHHPEGELKPLFSILSDRAFGPGKAWVRFALFLVLAAAFAQRIAAQGLAAMSGTISDASGATLTGASVTIRNIDTGLRRDV